MTIRLDHTAHRRMLAASPLPDDPAQLVDELRELEELTCAAQARQARLSLALDHVQRRAAEQAGVDDNKLSRGIAHQIALARRVSPHRGRQLLSLARHLAAELPHTHAAFAAGRITEWRASLIARESACLSRDQRAVLDEKIANDPASLENMGDRQIIGECRKFAAQLDPGAVAARRRRAETERRVSIRPAPDSMVYVTSLLPVAEGVGVYASLRAEAQTKVSTGEATNVSQAMADELVRRITGAPDGVQPVALRITVSDQALLTGAHDTAFLSGYGAIAASHARDLTSDAITAGHRTWFKSLYTDRNGKLVAMDSAARLFPAPLAEALDLRDQWCRTPWCDAPIRHHDHIQPKRLGGPTSSANEQGLCEACNLAKEAPGWRATTIDAIRHTVRTVTPTGHSYLSTAPPLPSPIQLPDSTALKRAG